MLVLSRKLDEVIRIGNDVEITVLAVKGNTVRIGIKAPREVKVLRAELPVNDTQRRSQRSLIHPQLQSSSFLWAKCAQAKRALRSICRQVLVPQMTRTRQRSV